MSVMQVICQSVDLSTYFEFILLGWKIIACTYHSRWYRRGRPDFGLATIEGDDTCKIDCKKRGELACAVYAKCFSKYISYIACM